MTNDESERLLSIEDVAERWGCSRVIVDKAVGDGSLVAVRIGKRYRFRIEDVKDYETRMATNKPKEEGNR